MNEAKKSDSTSQLGLAAQDLTGDAAWLWTHCRALGMVRRSDSGLMRDDVALYTTDLHAALDAAREHVRIPTSAAEAKAMATVALAWLRQHTPDELRPNSGPNDTAQRLPAERTK